MSKAIKWGPLWDRTVFDPQSRVVKHRLTRIRFDDVKQLRVREYIDLFEEEQLLNIHPEVQKAPRAAELWVDTKDGRERLVGKAERAGLLLASMGEAAGLIGVPLTSERSMLAVPAPLPEPKKTSGVPS